MLLLSPEPEPPVAEAVTGNEDVSEAIETAIEASSAVTASKAVADFYTGHNSVTTLSGIPTDKRLVIATLSASENNVSLSGNALADGSEIHVIVNNNSTDAISIATDGLTTPYKLVGNNISIAASSYGEINIISDGTTLYLRGA